jgi:hypothetical protein
MNRANCPEACCAARTACQDLPGFRMDSAMIKPMESSLEEFLLVLNRWKTEAAKVRVAASFPLDGEFVSTTVLEGRLALEERSSTLSVLSEDGSTFLLGFAGASVGYATPADIESGSLLALVQSPEEVEDILIVRHASATVCLFSLKP